MGDTTVRSSRLVLCGMKVQGPTNRYNDDE